MSVRSALKLFGLMRPAACRLRRWMEGEVAGRGITACQAMELMGRTMSLDSTISVLRWAKARMVVRQGPKCVADQFAGLGVASIAMSEVWPEAETTVMSEKIESAQRCLRVCYPDAEVREKAESQLPAGLWAVVAGFPCECHSPLTDVDFGKIKDSVALLRAALTWEQGSEPHLIVLENSAGILRAGFQHVNEMLLSHFHRFEWAVGIVEPCVHNNVPMSRERVFWVGIRRDVHAGEPNGTDAPVPGYGTAVPRRRSALYDP